MIRILDTYINLDNVKSISVDTNPVEAGKYETTLYVTFLGEGKPSIKFATTDAKEVQKWLDKLEGAK